MRTKWYIISGVSENVHFVGGYIKQIWKFPDQYIKTAPPRTQKRCAKKGGKSRNVHFADGCIGIIVIFPDQCIKTEPLRTQKLGRKYVHRPQTGNRNHAR